VFRHRRHAAARRRAGLIPDHGRPALAAIRTFDAVTDGSTMRATVTAGFERAFTAAAIFLAVASVALWTTTTREQHGA
jgi:hypothetical protein